jgi:diaminopropionate ammonia-lyase
MSFVLNSPEVGRSSERRLFSKEELQQAVKWFKSDTAYSPTPLLSLPGYAAEIGIRELLVKDESQRMGLNAFKILGVSYAVERLFIDGSVRKGSVVACATDGNHGRALACVARKRQLTARVFIHKAASPARVAAIEAEGAQVSIVNGNYDDSVNEAKHAAERNGWIVISDTAWPGYETVPRYIMAGYTMLIAEAAQQWTHPPDAVLVQAGVGGLAAAVVNWFVEMFGDTRPRLVSCEPETAACVLESIRAGTPVVVEGSLETIMAGLSCGTVSSLAWPVLKANLDACVAVSDAECANAVRRLARPKPGDAQIVAGESGACGVAALHALLNRGDFRTLCRHLDLGSHSRVLVINTEGATDPEAFCSIVGA